MPDHNAQSTNSLPQSTDLTPRQVVAELDRHIVGQNAAKRAVAVALRNRVRRASLAAELRADVSPKNILMIGPTGVGKTEIARRLAHIAGAPLLKVEATKFTEVGYVGREVDAIARDLVEVALAMVEKEHIERLRPRAAQRARERLLDLLAPAPPSASAAPNPFAANFPGMWPQNPPSESERTAQEQSARLREKMTQKLDAGELEDAEVEVEVEERRNSNVQFLLPEGAGPDLSEMLGPLMGGGSRKKRRVKVPEARRVLENQEAEALLDRDAVAAQAIERAEERGIVFLDEIDKIAGRGDGSTGQVSREGVQRDLLPLVEGATVATKYGPVKTDHVLFIAAGAFHFSKPSDLIPELQGRFPVRVELEALDEADLRRILTEPQRNLLHQYQALLGADGARIEFAEDGIAEIARLATHVNDTTENIGARRLHTLLERVLEEIAFEAPEMGEVTVRVDAPFVRARLSHLIGDDELTRLML